MPTPIRLTSGEFVDRYLGYSTPITGFAEQNRYDLGIDPHQHGPEKDDCRWCRHPVSRFHRLTWPTDHMIDLHAHYLSPSVLAAASEGLLPAIVENQRVIRFPSGPSDPVLAALTDLEGRLRWNDERGIEVQVLAPWMDITGDDLEGSSARTWCRAMNDGIAQDIEGNPRFRALAALPVANGEMAAQELRRCVEQLGFSGGAIPTQVNSKDLDEAGLEPLWEAAEALRVRRRPHRSRDEPVRV